MAEITSGTVRATPLGGFWIGALELASGADDGDTINLAHSNFLGDKVKEIVFAEGVRYDSAGTANPSPIIITTGTAKMMLGASGTFEVKEANRGDISDQARRIQFQALSYQE